MAFVQIIDFRTTRWEEGRAHLDEYRAKTAGRRTVKRGVVCQDRDDPEHYVNLVFFDSYEAAMQNSELPETQELSMQLGKLSDEAPKFLNLEVVMDED